jgi:invasion protein IalB
MPVFGRSPQWIKRNTAACWVALAMLAGGPQAVAADERFRDWTLLRLQADDCVLHHRAVAAKTGLVLADLFLTPMPQGGALISLRVPRGASLVDRPAYRHPGASRAVPLIWQSCNRYQCLAQVDVNAKERRRLERGRSIDLSFVPLKGAPPLSFRVSLSGVTRGLAAAWSCRQARTR